MATKTKKATVKKTEVETLTGTLHGKRYTVVLDDVHHSDEWSPSVLPILQEDGLGKVNLADGVTEFIFRDAEASTIAFVADAGNLKVDKFFKNTLVEDADDDGTSESV